MKLISDYHSHPQGHRIQPYTQGLLQPWIESARERGLNDIAFTDHDRYHAGINFDELDKLRDANPDIKIRAGIELDNDPETSAAGSAWVEKNWEQLDFVLGSVHYLDDPTQMFDSVPDGAGQFVGRDINEVYEDYFRRIREIAATDLIDCLSHLDLIKIHGHRPCGDIRAVVSETLNFIRDRNLAVELSTAGWRKPVDELYPPTKSSGWQWRKEYSSRPLQTRIRTCSLARTTNDSGRRWSSWAFTKSASSKNTSA